MSDTKFSSAMVSFRRSQVAIGTKAPYSSAEEQKDGLHYESEKSGAVVINGKSIYTSRRHLN